MWIRKFSSSLAILIGCQWCVCAQASTSSSATDCDARLEQARDYEMAEDPRAESEFRMVLAATGDQCPDAFLELSQHLSRNLKFREAAAALKPYLRLMRADERGYNVQDVRDLLRAAELKERVETSKQPQLNDLLKLTHTIEIYGRHHRKDAVSYAENALKLYPDSVSAILSLVDLLLPEREDKERLEALLNRAVTLEPRNAKVYANRGWLFLFWRSDPKYAEEDFSKALLLSGDRNVTAWKGLGYIYMRRGDKQAALRAFRTYVRLNKSGPNGDIVLLIEQLSQS